MRVYKQRAHIINVFIAEAPGGDRQGKLEPQRAGFNIWSAKASGFAFSAVSDISADEFEEFGAKFQVAVRKSEGFSS